MKKGRTWKLSFLAFFIVFYSLTSRSKFNFPTVKLLRDFKQASYCNSVKQLKFMLTTGKK